MTLPMANRVTIHHQIDTVHAEDMSPGDMGIVVDGGTAASQEGRIIMACYQPLVEQQGPRLVCLETGDTWSVCPNFLLEPVSSVTINRREES